jgi:hypothetical protein
MSSPRRREGYLLIDNSSGPGVSEEQLLKLPRKYPVLAVPEGKKFETNLLTCSHCHRQMFRNPLRTRDRGSCGGICRGYLCDWCGAEYGRTRECKSMKAMLDKMQEQSFLREQAGLPPGEIIVTK